MTDSSDKKAVKSKATTAEGESAEAAEPQEEAAAKFDPLHLACHVGEGAKEVLIQHLNGVVMGLSHFLEAREQAKAEDKTGTVHTLRHITSARRKYAVHTHQASADFMDHVLSYEGKKKPDQAKSA
jgi:hypothetical protein